MKKAVIVAIILLLLSVIFNASLLADTQSADQVQSETQSVDQVPADTQTTDQVPAETPTADQLPESVETPGRIAGTGTYFEVTDSRYLDISLASSAEVKLTLESVPRVVTIAIESAAGDASTQVTLGGLLPSTTYYKYEDNFHNLQVFSSDAAGTYVFLQDLKNSHLIFIQETHSTYFIADDVADDVANDVTADVANDVAVKVGGGGDCAEIGTWDAVNKICTLTMDVNQTIQIDSNGITLDGAGHMITKSQDQGGSSGIFLPKRKNVTIKNLTIEGFSYGIRLDQSDSNVLVENYIDNNDSAIYLSGSNNNQLTDNTLYENYRGIFLVDGSAENVLTENTVTNNTYSGISLSGANNNEVTDNNVSLNVSISNGYGIHLNRSNNNQLTGNMVDANSSTGVYLMSSSNENTLTGNTLSNNGKYGLVLYMSDRNIIYHNNFTDNKIQVGIKYSIDNIFNVGAVEGGGNYWSDWDECIDDDDDGFCDEGKEGCIDVENVFCDDDDEECSADSDGFCDAPYVIGGISDAYPWTIANGWRDSDGDGIADDEDDCPDAAGPADQNGCPYVDETHVTMRIVDYQHSGVCGFTKRGWRKNSCIVDLEAVNVRVYNLEDEQFSKTYGRWPSRRRLADIYQADVGLTGLCTTGKNGKCLVGDNNQGQTLVIAKYADIDSRKTVYIGKFKDFRPHHGNGCGWGLYDRDDDADGTTPLTKITKNLHITKLIQRNGYVSFLGKYMMTVSGP